MWLLGYIVLHIICGFIAYRLFWNDWLDQFGEITRNDRRFFRFSSCFGPISLIGAFVVSRPKKADEVIYRRP